MTLFFWGFFGLIAFLACLYVDSLFRFRKRGFRSFFAGSEFYYEECRRDGIQTVKFGREIQGKGPDVIWVPSQEDWDRVVPEFARGRRAEIINRIYRDWKSGVIVESETTGQSLR
jgi:hypothetical protein